MKLLQPLLTDTSSEVRYAAAAHLLHSGEHAAAVPVLAELARDPKGLVAPTAIEVYLRADLPNVPQAARIAEVLAARLYHYVRQPSPNEVTRTSSVLEALLPDGVVLRRKLGWAHPALQADG